MKILLATDFTPASNHAINFITKVSKSWKSKEVSFILVHAFKPLVPYSEAPSVPVIESDDQARESNEAFKKQLEILRQEVNVSGQYFERGSLPSVMKLVIGEESPDLIVMGTREKDAFERMTIGSNTIEVAMQVEVPVLAVPKEVSSSAIKEVVYASDLDDEKDLTSGIKFLDNWVSVNNAQLDVLHVSTENDKDTLIEKMKASKLHQALSKVKHKHYPVINDSVFDGINSFIEEHQPDMLAAIPGDRSFFEKIFHRSTTEKMAYHLNIPLLILS